LAVRQRGGGFWRDGPPVGLACRNDPPERSSLKGGGKVACQSASRISNRRREGRQLDTARASEERQSCSRMS
jgi:hypothetical protein